MANRDTVKKWVALFFILGIFLLSYLVLKEILVPIAFGLLFSYIFSPVYKKINRKIPHKNLAAFILVIGILIVVSIPIIYFIPALVKQTFNIYSLLQNFDFVRIFNQYAETEIAQAIAINLDNLLGKFFSTLLTQLSNLLVNLPSILLQLAVFLFTFFFAVRDSDKLNEYVTSLSPFSVETEKKFLREFRGITNAIIFGQVLIGIIQGLAVGLGMYFLGVENLLLLTFVACVFSIIPVLGSWAVWLPVGVIHVIQGNPVPGFIFLLYGGFFVSSIDNIVRPVLLSKRSNLPVALSIIGTIGGLYFFGIAGLILGPLILAYLLIIIEFYRQGKLDELFKKPRGA